MSERRWLPAAGLLALILVVGTCTADPPPCGGTCDVAERCVEGVCRRICANQLHCWSGCCLPEPRTGDAAVYNVCMPEEACR